MYDPIYKISDGILIRQFFDEEWVITRESSNESWIINKSASKMLETCQEGASKKQLIEVLMSAYSEPISDKVLEDVNNSIVQLLLSKIIYEVE